MNGSVSSRTKRFLSASWPYVVFGVLAVVYSYFHFRAYDPFVLKYIEFLLSVITALAVVVYVIYTRQLAQSSHETAQANRQLIESMRCLLIEDWDAQERPTAEIRLIRGAVALSEEIHMTDMGTPEELYRRQVAGSPRRILIFKPFNSGSRVVLLRRVKFEISHTRGRGREISFDPETPVKIAQNESIEVHVAHDFGGEIEARVVEIEYLDGDRVQSAWIASPWRELRYFPPEPAGGAGH